MFNFTIGAKHISVPLFVRRMKYMSYTFAHTHIHTHTKKTRILMSHRSHTEQRDDLQFSKAICLMFYFGVDSKDPSAHINQPGAVKRCAPAYSVNPNTAGLCRPHDLLGRGRKKKHLGGYICSATFPLPRQLTSVNYLSPESNTFSLCQVISLGSQRSRGRGELVLHPS